MAMKWMTKIRRKGQINLKMTLCQERKMKTTFLPDRRDVRPMEDDHPQEGEPQYEPE